MALRAGVRFSRRADGDFQIDRDPVELARLRAEHESGSWTWLRQVHGARVITVDAPGVGAGEPADAAVTALPDVVLAVHTADCAPVMLRSSAGIVGAAHVGWRGLVAGVLEATVEAMTDLGAGPVHAVVGPHIRARCYEFGVDDLDRVAERYGPEVRSTTAWGTPALDVLAGIRNALGALAVVSVVDHGGCTACEPDSYFSHRARGDVGRLVATTVLRDLGPDAPGRPS